VKSLNRKLAAVLFTLFLLVIAPPKSTSAAIAYQGCMLSSGQWLNASLFQVETGTFRVTFDATPSATTIDGVTGLSSTPATAYAGFYAAVRFNTSGAIQARSGSAYTSVASIPYSANVAYHFILDVNVATHTYNAYVMIGSVQTIIGTNLVFRNELAPVASLSYLVAMTTPGANTVCNVAVSAIPVAPSISTQPASVSVTVGHIATFSVASHGTSPMTYQWQKNGAIISGATSSNYSTPVTSMSDNNEQFTVVISNTAGTITSNSALLTVTAIAPSITAQPLAQSVTVGQSATLSVASTGTAPMIYQWSRNGSLLVGATSSSYTTALTTLSDNGAQFGVSVSNSAATIASIPALLTVKAAVPPPGCLQSSGTWMNARLTQVQIGTFRVSYDSTPASAMMNGIVGLSPFVSNAYADLAAGTRFSPTGMIDARNGAAFTSVTPIPYSAGVTYHFILDVNIAAHTYNAYVIINGVQTAIGTKLAFRVEQGAATSLAYLSSMSSVGNQMVCNIAISAAPATAPTITTQPVSGTVIAGQPASFSVVAAGTATLTYQWSKNSAVIAGATSASYTTPATLISDSGAQFSATISNSAGIITSSAAVLTVSVPLSLILNSSAASLNFGSVTLSSSGSENVSLTNAGTGSVTISQVMISGAGFNATGASGTILTPGQSTTVTSTFIPSGSGIATGTLTISSNATPISIALSGTGVAAVAHTVTLNWSPAVSGVTGFNTYSSTVSGGPYNKLTSAPLVNSTYIDSSVQSGHTYYYVVTAVDASNEESTYSTEVSAIIP